MPPFRQMYESSHFHSSFACEFRRKPGFWACHVIFKNEQQDCLPSPKSRVVTSLYLYAYMIISSEKGWKKLRRIKASICCVVRILTCAIVLPSGVISSSIADHLCKFWRQFVNTDAVTFLKCLVHVCTGIAG